MVGPGIRIKESDDKSESFSQSENDNQLYSNNQCETSGQSAGDSQSENYNQRDSDTPCETSGPSAGDSQSENDNQCDSDTQCQTSGPSAGDSQSENDNQPVIDKLFDGILHASGNLSGNTSQTQSTTLTEVDKRLLEFLNESFSQPESDYENNNDMDEQNACDVSSSDISSYNDQSLYLYYNSNVNSTSKYDKTYCPPAKGDATPEPIVISSDQDEDAMSVYSQ